MGRPAKPISSAELAKILDQVGANIRLHREGKEMSQIALAKRAKISLTTLNEIEGRRFRDIRLSTLSALAQALQVPFIKLLERSAVQELSRTDQLQLLKASESIRRIAKKMK